MKTKRTSICNICGARVNAQGLGGHKMLKHGVVEKLIVTNTSFKQSQHRVDEQKHVFPTQINTGSTQVQHEIPIQVNTSSTQDQHMLPTHVRRPQDYVKKGDVVIEKKIVPIWNTEKKEPVEKFDCRCKCEICMACIPLSNKHFKRDPCWDGVNVVCENCLKKMRKEDIDGLWWTIPNTNNRRIRLDYFQTGGLIKLSEFIKTI